MRQAVRSAVVGVSLSAAVLAGCGSTSTTSASSPQWKTYRYGQIEISAPVTWKVVKHYEGCPNAPARNRIGTLLLGSSTSPAISCAGYPLTEWVSVQPVAGEGDLCMTRVKVNGLTAWVSPCASNAQGITSWYFPTLGLVATGSGTHGHAGTGTSTIEGRILHSIRMATKA